MKYGFIYETTNLVNGKKYIGSHVRSLEDIHDPDDSWYLGSGFLLEKAIDKYGRENFSRVILHECDTDEDLSKMETYYLESVDAAGSFNYYNLTNSGYKRGIKGYTHTEDSRKSMKENNYVHKFGRTVSSRQKQSETLKKNNHQSILADSTRDTVWVTNGEINRRLKREGLDDYLFSNESWYIGFTSNRENIKISDEGRKNMSDSRKNFYQTDHGKCVLAERFKDPRMNPKGKIWISKEGKKLMIYPEDLLKYMSEGWKRGMKN